jgi:hypothetical protein
VPDWKRIIVGDAFQLSSHDLNYFRDLFLAWPLLLFTIAGLVDLFSGGQNHRLAIRCLALSLVALLLARERLILIAGALGFCAVQTGISFVLRHDWIALTVSVLSGALFLLLIISFKEYKPSYSVRRGHTIADLLVGLSSLGFTIALFSWIRR